MKATPRVRKIALLGKFAYPELRLIKLQYYLQPVARKAKVNLSLWLFMYLKINTK
ncbi:hypothetical protein PAUR_a1570 [Pseudoalteromonas aurantia 208]|uniref:Uncharacterized protein n=1 Tax=Pseudoalteromonas aurantia 208 TaxID=1314867 RepID=A0ABR9EAP0_9GAMM|nr:hypothetical protein [Pseudoalteromonas aurantia 208]